MGAVPWLVVTHEELLEVLLDRRAGIVLSFVDGRCTVEAILRTATLSEDEVLGILAKLACLGVIEFHGP